MKKLLRSKNNKIIAGVCGGLSEYFKVDPSLVRVILAVIVLAGHGMPIFIVAYIVCWVVMPSEQ